jgi:hypothetical protein
MQAVVDLHSDRHVGLPARISGWAKGTLRVETQALNKTRITHFLSLITAQEQRIRKGKHPVFWWIGRLSSIFLRQTLLHAPPGCTRWRLSIIPNPSLMSAKLDWAFTMPAKPVYHQVADRQG